MRGCTWVLWGVVAFNVAATTARGAEPADPARQEEAPPAPESAPPPAARFAQLTEIRRALGGGSLEGTLLESPFAGEAGSEAEFLDALQRVASKTPQLPAASTANEDGYCPSLNLAPQSADEELMHALRTAARELDDKANQLEFEQAYPQADRFRRLAQRLRREARLLTPDTTHQSASPR